MSEARERPIVFSGTEVRALLDGRASRGSNNDRKINVDHAAVADAYNKGQTIKEIAAHLGCSTEPVRRILREAGVQRRPAKQRPGRMSGDRNPAWNGGRRVRPDGYIEVWTPDGPQLEHRVVMQHAIGRPLSEGEVVHHIDRNKQNNELSNLELTTQAEHAREHAPEMHAARHGR